MEEKTIDGVFTDIAEATRAKTGNPNKIKPENMAAEINSIKVGADVVANNGEPTTADLDTLKVGDTNYKIQNDVNMTFSDVEDTSATNELKTISIAHDGTVDKWKLGGGGGSSGTLQDIGKISSRYPEYISFTTEEIKILDTNEHSFALLFVPQYQIYLQAAVDFLSGGINTRISGSVLNQDNFIYIYLTLTSGRADNIDFSIGNYNMITISSTGAITISKNNLKPKIKYFKTLNK